MSTNAQNQMQAQQQAQAQQQIQAQNQIPGQQQRQAQLLTAHQAHQQAYFQHKAQAIHTHHVEAIVVNYLEQFPAFFATMLHKHEQWLAIYLRSQYGIELSVRQAVLRKEPVPLAGSRRQAPSTANQHLQRASKFHLQRAPETHLQRASEFSSKIPSANYQKPSVENVASYESPHKDQVDFAVSTYNDRGGSPASSTSSQSSAWPTEEDLSVPYPAPDKHLEKEAGLNKGKGYKWTFEEQDLAIGYMFAIRDDPSIPKTEKRFEEISRRLMENHGIQRTKDSVKNMWNRIGRHRSQYDERKHKTSTLATSAQGKQARLENEAKRNGKRKAMEEPSAAPQKKIKTPDYIDPRMLVNGDVSLPTLQANDFDAFFSNLDDFGNPDNVMPPNKSTELTPEDELELAAYLHQAVGQEDLDGLEHLF